VTRPGTSLSLLATAGLLTAAPAAAQWTADLYAGGTRQAALAGYVADVNLIGNVRYAGRSESFLYFSAAAPLGNEAVPWGAAGAGCRCAIAGGDRAGIDVSGHGYIFRGRAEPTGTGASVHVLPYIGWGGTTTRAELRAGRHEHRLRFAGDVQGGGLYEIGVRAGASHGVWVAQLDGRWLADDTTSYPFTGLQLGGVVGDVQLWGGAGRWHTPDASSEWSVGVAVNVPLVGQLWFGMRADARDPLYRNAERTSWNLGISRALGRPPRAARLPAPTRVDDGLVFRLPRQVVPGSGAAPPAIAGEFSDWAPLPMQRSNGEWVLQVPLAAGVHRFAFVTADGEWFVPEGYPGRIDDGMGGWVAVVVVR
jgi:hypothetical protein